MKAKLQTVIPLQSKIIHYDKRYRSFSHAAVYKATNQKFGKLVANALHLHDLSAMKPLLMSSHGTLSRSGKLALAAAQEPNTLHNFVLQGGKHGMLRCS